MKNFIRLGTVDTQFVYNTLIKAYVKARIYEPNLLRRMILGGARPDRETYSLLKLAEQFRPLFLCIF